MTPEGKIKRKIKTILDTYNEYGIYYYMPVPGGFGRSSLDYLGFLMGYGFAIEAKRENLKPTDRQLAIMEQIVRSGAAVFLIRDTASLAEFNDWCQSIVAKETIGKRLDKGEVPQTGRWLWNYESGKWLRN